MASKAETLQAFNTCMCPPSSLNEFKCENCSYKRYVNCADKLRGDVRRVLEEDTKRPTYTRMFQNALDAYCETKQRNPSRIIMNETCYKLLNDDSMHGIPEGYATFQGIRVEVIHTPEKDPFFVFVDSWNKVKLTKM